MTPSQKPEGLSTVSVEELEHELASRVVDPIDLRSFPPVAPLSRIPESWRQTFLAKYALCPRDAYLYVKYDGGALSHPLAGGTLLHRAIERFIKHVAGQGERMGEPETAKDILNEVLVESSDLTVSPDRFDSCRAMMFHMANGLRIDPDQIVCLETPVELVVGERRVTGTIDFAEYDPLERTLDVLDWKSAFHNAARDDVEEDEQNPQEAIPSKENWPGSFQLILYALAIATGSVDGQGPLEGIDRFRLRQVHPRQFWEYEGVMAYREAVITREQLLDWQLYLEAVVEELTAAFETWEFPAIHGSHCRYCTSSAECPIPPAARNYMGEIRTADDARRAAIFWDRLTDYRKTYWDALKGWAETAGDHARLRFGRDRELKWKKTESEKVKDKVELPGSKKKVKGKVALREAVHRSTELGVPFIWADFHTTTVSTRYSVCTLTPAELNNEKGTPS